MSNNTAPAPEIDRDDDDQPDVVAINVPLPRNVHTALRIRAIQEGCSMKAAIITAIEDWTMGD